MLFVVTNFFRLLQLKIRLPYLFLMLLLSFYANNNCVAQPLIISAVIQENKIATYQNQKLIFVDFWATWCVPCDFANQQLEIFQNKHKDKVFVMSISNEDENQIRSHVDKMKMNLMVIADANSETFNRYRIEALPSSMLINSTGKIIWSGHPSDMTEQRFLDIYQQAASHTKKISDYYILKPSSFVERITKQIETPPKTPSVFQAPISTVLLDTPISKIPLDSFSVVDSDNQEVRFVIDNNQVSFNGRIGDLLEQLYGVSKHQIHVNPNKNIFIQVNANEEIWTRQSDKIIDFLKKKYGIKIGKSKRIFHSWLFKRIEKKTTFQVKNNLNESTLAQEYMIDEEKITATQMTIKKMLSVLGNELTTIVINDDDTDTSFYEWDLHYKNIETLKKELLDGYGILLKKSLALRDIHVVN